ncbi:MAG: site-2 protease family protein [Sphaerobacteraceae bacterium]|nr:MAG: site-2 protease family protein [Sphaerobacteraceae bacterium]
MFDFGSPDPITLISILLAFAVGITIHEFCHAWSALLLGDDTAARQGRVTLNPLSHLDPIGSIGVLAIAVLGIGIGWGRPVPVNPARIRWKQRGLAITAVAGPVSNVVIATIFVIPLRLIDTTGVDPTIITIATNMVLVNLLLASFNLIPIPPLDGHKILVGLLPNFWYPFLAPLERYGIGILLVLIMSSFIFGGSILFEMYSPVYNALRSLMLG